MEQQFKVYDYINNVISLADNPEDFKESNFAILCDRYPIQLSKNKYLAKVLYMSIKKNKQSNTLSECQAKQEDVWRLYPDKIKEYDIEHIVLSTNSRRRINYKMQEFFVNGSNEEQRTSIQKGKDNDRGIT